MSTKLMLEKTRDTNSSETIEKISPKAALKIVLAGKLWDSQSASTRTNACENDKAPKQNRTLELGSTHK